MVMNLPHIGSAERGDTYLVLSKDFKSITERKQWVMKEYVGYPAQLPGKPRDLRLTILLAYLSS
jgi:hypothetical protein